MEASRPGIISAPSFAAAKVRRPASFRCFAYAGLARTVVATPAPLSTICKTKGFSFEEKLRIDCFVDRCLIVECKSLDEEKVNMIRHKAQLLSDMKLMNIPLGLVINFGDYRLGKRGIARVIIKGADGGDPF